MTPADARRPIFTLRWLLLATATCCVVLAIYRWRPAAGIVAAATAGPLFLSLTLQFGYGMPETAAGVVAWLTATAAIVGFVGALLGCGLGILVLWAHLCVAPVLTEMEKLRLGSRGRSPEQRRGQAEGAPSPCEEEDRSRAAQDEEA